MCAAVGKCVGRSLAILTGERTPEVQELEFVGVAELLPKGENPGAAYVSR